MEKEKFCPLASPYQAIEGQRGTLICLREACAWWISKETVGIEVDFPCCAVPMFAVYFASGPFPLLRAKRKHEILAEHWNDTDDE